LRKFDQVDKLKLEINSPILFVIKTSMEPNNTILDALTNAGRFDSLLSAIEAADVEDMLTTEEEYTVFAPNDEAFAKLDAMLQDKGTSLAAVLAEQDTLARILSYHVVPGRHDAAEVSGMESGATVPTTLSQMGSEDAETLEVTKSGDSIMVGGAKVVATDIMADNGVIHEIDTVLMPPGLSM
jgi:uncharacterized surface protein with fasciclin (FAS1) repeats